MRVLSDSSRSQLPALFWVAGGLLLGQFAGSAGAPRIVPLALAALALLAWLIVRRWWALTPTVAAAVLVALFGYWQVARVRWPDLAADHVRNWVGERVVLRGRVAKRPVQRPGKVRLTIEATELRLGRDGHPARGRVLVTVQHTTQAWRRGDSVEAMLGLRQPRNFGNPGEFDFETYLARRGVWVTAFAADDRAWQRTPAALGWATAIENWREETATTIAGTLPAPTAAIAAALLIGDAVALPDDVRDRFARAGVSHVLSISGLHVGLVASVAFVVLRWLLGRSERLLLQANVPKLAMAISLVPLAIYAAIAGDNVATIRSEIMGVLVVSAVLLDRPRDWLAPLAAAALAISLYEPGALAEISFQLSFVAVLAIVLGMGRVIAWWNEWEERHLVRLRGPHWRWVRWLVLFEAVTVCATLGTAPLTAWHFNQVSLVALLANPIIVPLLGLVCVTVGLLGVVAVALVPAAAPLLFHAIGWLVWLADALVRLCAAIPGASIIVATPTVLELLLIYAALAALLLTAARLRRTVLTICVIGLVLDAGYWRMPRSDLQITFVSVGQGDCAIVEFPGGPVMVVDGGGLSGDFDVGRQVVAPVLWRRKITRVDALALSHADYDHFGGLTFLAQTFAPAAFWWNGMAGNGPRFAALWDALQDEAVPLLVLRSGFRQTIGGVDVRVLHPRDTAPGRDNDGSLTLQLRYGGVSVLLPGDLEADGERTLVASHGAALQSAILKVPHHGSRTSSTAALVDAVAPRIAVVSVGAANRFGFPHPAVVDAYQRRGSALLRTDRDGAVTLRISAAGDIAIRTGKHGS